MTDKDKDDESDDETTDSPGGSVPLGDVFASLSNLLDQLEELDDTERRSGSLQRGDARFDYSVNVGSINPAGESRRDRRRPTWDIRGESDEREYRARVNEDDGELVVVVDLPAVSAEDVDVGTNEDTGALEISVDNEVVEAVPLDWDGATVSDVTFRNQILEVHVSPPERGDGTDDTDYESDSDGGAST